MRRSDYSVGRASLIGGRRTLSKLTGAIRLLVKMSASAVVVAGCAGNVGAGLPTYPYRGIDLLSAVQGTLTREGDCVILLSGEERWVPVWPTGTVLSSEGVKVPERNGGILLRFGEAANLEGARRPSGEGARNFNRVLECRGTGFLVSQAKEYRDAN